MDLDKLFNWTFWSSFAFTDYDSALMTVVNGDEPDHLDMIGSEVIQRLLMDKWKAFAEVTEPILDGLDRIILVHSKRKMYERLALLVLQLFNLSFVAYLRPASLKNLYMSEPEVQDWVGTWHVARDVEVMLIHLPGFRLML